jgi:hypothetical protein
LSGKPPALRVPQSSPPVRVRRKLRWILGGSVFHQYAKSRKGKNFFLSGVYITFAQEPRRDSI